MRLLRNAPRLRIPVRGYFTCYITDRGRLGEVPLPSCIRRAVAAGVDFVQIREKDLSDRDLFALTVRAAAIARGTRCRILVNGRADIALAAGAAGVHLPSSGLKVEHVRKWAPAGFLVGVSCHSLRDAKRAASSGADYILLGPVFPTPSKLKYGPPLGLKYLKGVCAAVELPVLGLGGITPGKIDSVIAAGAAGVAGISLFQQLGTDHAIFSD